MCLAVQIKAQEDEMVRLEAELQYQWSQGVFDPFFKCAGFSSLFA